MNISSKTKPGEATERNFYIVNDALNLPVQVHHYGTYLSFSDPTGDYLTSARQITPYKVTEKYEVQIGTESVIVNKGGSRKEVRVMGDGTKKTVTVYDGSPTIPEIEERPIYEVNVRDATPQFKAYGKPIAIGDAVNFSDIHSGTLVGLFETHFVIATFEGDHYFPWKDVHGVRAIRRQG